MSAAVRFAPMTSALLSRKGDAKPTDAPAEAFLLDRRDAILERSSMTLQKDQVALQIRTESSSNERLGAARFANNKSAARRRHSISLSVSDSEFERLGIAAVKKRVNRQQLLRLAVDHYLEQLSRDFRSECQCISVAGSCSCSNAS